MPVPRSIGRGRKSSLANVDMTRPEKSDKQASDAAEKKIADDIRCVDAVIGLTAIADSHRKLVLRANLSNVNCCSSPSTGAPPPHGGLIHNAIARRLVMPYRESVKVHFKPELQARLTQRASQQGRNPDEFVQDVIARYLEEEDRFIEAVEDALKNGNHLTHEQVGERLHRFLQS